MSEVFVTPEGDQQAIVHFETRRRIACSAEAVLHASSDRQYSLARTNDWRAVTCAFCEMTEAYREAKEMIPLRRVT